ncbi:MAG: tRNA (N6-isopentenyl adenosine(37)-C2)-methylthiotransferase MiaB [Planctomycetota bacterium]
MTSKRTTIFLRTFGCQMNKLDSALIEASLQGEGFDLVGSIEDADVVLMNTCSVRDHAEQRVFSHLGHLKHIKESRPGLVVGVVGCMAQRLGSELFKQSVVDIVCGPAQIADIPRLISEAIQEKKKTIAVTEKIRQAAPDGQALETFETEYGIEDSAIPGQAYVRAMHGCDKFCTYCVVPYVRGPETSRPPAAIVGQAKRLAQHGVKQVTLLGQRINAYEYNAGDKTYTLADLFGLISDIDGIEWIRFVTSYPSQKYFAEIMQAIAALPKACRYLHLPAQSGSDTILKTMNRGYTSAEYLDLIDTARQIVPDIAIAGDFIVGFPGETDDDFKQTESLLKKAQYKNSFIFKYSPRPGTSADNRLEDNIPQEIKSKRNIELLKLQEKISAELAQAFLGKTVKVLIEGPSKKSHPDSPQLIGRTTGDWIVVFDGPPLLAGQFAQVKITKTTPLTLFGEIP